MSATTGRAFGEGGRLGAKKQNLLVEVADAAISPNCS